MRKQNEMGEAHTAHMAEVKNMWQIFVIKPEGRETLM